MRRRVQGALALVITPDQAASATCLASFAVETLHRIVRNVLASSNPSQQEYLQSPSRGG